jgi:hypothetical protein
VVFTGFIHADYIFKRLTRPTKPHGWHLIQFGLVLRIYQLISDKQ